MEVGVNCENTDINEIQNQYEISDIDGIWNQYENEAISKLCNCWHKLCQVKGRSAFDTFD